MSSAPFLPKRPVLAELWAARRKLLDEVTKYNHAINALQALCGHPNEVDVSRHGSPDYECPDCGRGRLP